MSKSVADAGDVKVVVNDEETAPLKTAAAKDGVAIAPAAKKPQQEMAVPMHARLSNAGEHAQLTRFEFGGGNPFSRLFLNCESKSSVQRSLFRSLHFPSPTPPRNRRVSPARYGMKSHDHFIVCSSPIFRCWSALERHTRKQNTPFVHEPGAADCAREPTEYSHATIIFIVCNPVIRTQL